MIQRIILYLYTRLKRTIMNFSYVKKNFLLYIFFGFRRISRSFPLSFFALIENQYPSSRILLDFQYGGTSNVI